MWYKQEGWGQMILDPKERRQTFSHASDRRVLFGSGSCFNAIIFAGTESSGYLEVRCHSQPAYFGAVVAKRNHAVVHPEVSNNAKVGTRIWSNIRYDPKPDPKAALNVRNNPKRTVVSNLGSRIQPEAITHNPRFTQKFGWTRHRRLFYLVLHFYLMNWLISFDVSCVFDFYATHVGLCSGRDDVNTPKVVFFFVFSRSQTCTWTGFFCRSRSIEIKGTRCCGMTRQC